MPDSLIHTMETQYRIFLFPPEDRVHPPGDPRVLEAVGGGAVSREVRGVAVLGQAPLGGRHPRRGPR